MSLLEKINRERAKLQRGNANRPEKISSEKNLIRILPSWDGTVEGDFHQYWGQHFIKDTAGNLKAVYICTQTVFDEPCEVCNMIAQGAAATADEEILKALKEARSSNRVLVNALYLKGGKNDNPTTQPVVLELAPTVFDMILAAAQAYMEEDVNVFSLEEGVNFIVERTGTGFNTEYKVTPAPKSTKIDASVMDKVRNLRDWARQESETELNKAVTSVRVIAGVGGSMSAPRLTHGSGSAGRLSNVDADVVDAEYEVEQKPKVDASDLDSEIDEFLKDL